MEIMYKKNEKWIKEKAVRWQMENAGGGPDRMLTCALKDQELREIWLLR